MNTVTHNALEFLLAQDTLQLALLGKSVETLIGQLCSTGLQMILFLTNLPFPLLTILTSNTDITSKKERTKLTGKTKQSGITIWVKKVKNSNQIMVLGHTSALDKFDKDHYYLLSLIYYIFKKNIGGTYVNKSALWVTGTFVPMYFCSRERKYVGTKVP